MLTFKELEQLLQPIQPQDDSQLQSQQPVQPNNKTQQQNKANPKSQIKPNPQNQKFSLSLTHRQLRKVPPLIPFKQYIITRLDLIFNYLKDIKPMKQQATNYLQYLNISFNFLTSIDKLGCNFAALKVLDLNANRIITVNIADAEFPSLQALYLKNNKIKYFLNCPNSLQILCLDHNQLERLAFTGGKKLQILSASTNKIQQFQLQQPSSLCFLDLQQNQIHDPIKLKQTLKNCQNLLSLNLIGNYVSKISHKKYVIEVLVTCPKLVKVDQVFINPHVRQAFKIMNEEDKMQLQMKQTQQKYRKRMQQQFKLKQEILDKLRQQQRLLDQNFKNFMQNEKEQMDMLENYAKNNMGKKIMGIPQENKGFNDLARKYDNQSANSVKNTNNNQNPLDIFNMKDNSSNQIPPNLNATQLGNQLTKFLVEGQIILKHKNQYADYLKNKQQEKVSKQSKIKKYLGIPQNNQRTQNNTKNQNKNISNQSNKQSPNQQIQDSNSDQDNDEQEQLSLAEKQRRKKNMRNPALVYRNSNQLIGAPPLNIDQDMNEDQDMVFNKKFLPYLVKNYGFHTVI